MPAPLVDLARNLALNPRRVLRVFTGLVVVPVIAVFAAAPPGASKAANPPVLQLGDELGPGFFSPPPGIRPVNKIAESRFPQARRSYAWRIHNGKRELIEFATPIQHVVVIYMENRTPENLFGAFWGVTNPTTHHTFGSDLDLVDPDTVTGLSPHPLTYTGNPNHDHSPGFVNEVNNDYSLGGLWYVPTPSSGSGASPSVNNYIDIIENWGYEAHVLQSNEGPSFEAHQYAISGQSGGLSDSNIVPYGMANNPKPGLNPDPGLGSCYLQTMSQTVATVDMYGSYPWPVGPPATPCNEYPTILDAMASAAPSTPPYDQWQYVAFNNAIIWAAPMAVRHLYNAYNSGVSPEIQPFAVDPDAENWVLNIKGSATPPTPNPARPFAELTYLTPCLHESDHPNPQGADNGPDWLSYILNAIGSSEYWNTTAVIVTWDDWGGFYDNYTPAAAGTTWPYHMTPNPYSAPPNTGNTSDPNEWGYRVPLMVLSPYLATPGVIATPLISQGAILNFIENNFDLGNNLLGGDDLTNGTHDLSEMFNFSRIAPIPWSPLPSNFTPAYNATCPP